MANKYNPMGAKPVTNILTSQYTGKTNKYYIPATDTDDIFENDVVKLVTNSNSDGIPIVAKAAAGDKPVGIVTRIHDILPFNNITYREGSSAVFVDVLDDPWVEFEIQASGTIVQTDIGKNADIIVGSGNVTTGISGTQLDVSTITTNVAQIKILGVIEQKENILGEYSHLRCIFGEHEYKDISNYQEDIWERSGIEITPKTAGDNLDMGTGNITGADGTFSGDITAVNGDYSGDVKVEGFTMHGSLIVGMTTTATDYNPSALTDDYIIAITNTSAPRAIIISTEDVESGSVTNPRVIVIKDETGGAATNNISIGLENGGTIDGSLVFTLFSNYASVTLYLDGTDAHII